MSNIICFESKTLLMYQNSTNWLGSDENLPMENLSDKILKILFIRYVTRKLRVLRETGPWRFILLSSQVKLTVKNSVSSFPSEPASLTAERNPSRKVLRLDVSMMWIGISATCSANLHNVPRWDPMAPTQRKFPL